MFSPSSLFTALVLIGSPTYAQETNNQHRMSPPGTNRGGCPQTVMLDITLDSFGDETTWTLFDNTATNIVAQGGPYPEDLHGTVITEELCLQEDCYYLEVRDAGGNGIEGGGYVLRHSNGRRIIVADGQFGSVSGLRNQHRFCLPTSGQGLIQSQCDDTELEFSSDQQLYASLQPGAKGYEFWIFDPHGSYSRKVYRPSAVVTPYNLVSNPVPADLDLNVRVRTHMDDGSVRPWGRACVVRFNSVVPPEASERSMQELGKQDNELVLYPNPSDGRAMHLIVRDLEEGTHNARVDVFDVKGACVHSTSLAMADGILDAPFAPEAGLRPGIYSVVVTTGTRVLSTRLSVH